MSEINAIRNAVRAERQLIQTERAAQRALPSNVSEVVTPKPKNIAKTATGREVDISRGYNVRGPDGVKIPFKVDTPIEKAKEWTKNFYAPEKDFEIAEGISVSLPDSKVKHFTLQRKDMGGLDGLAFEQAEDGTYQVRMAQLSSGKKGAGIGAGMYRQLFEKARKEGVRVKSDSSMTEDSIAIWRRFKELGYPVKEHPMVKTGKMFMGKNQYMRKGAKAEDDAPLFEFDGTQQVKKDVKPHLEAAKNPVRKPDDADRVILALRRQQGVPPETREKILDVYNDYKVAEDPAKQQELLEQLRTMIPAEKPNE